MESISTISFSFLLVVAILFAVSVYSPRYGTFGKIRSRKIALPLYFSLAVAFIAVGTATDIPRLAVTQDARSNRTAEIIVAYYSELPTTTTRDRRQYLILSSGEEFYKTREHGAKKPPDGIPGKYFYSEKNGDLNYEIVLNEDGSAIYEKSRGEIRAEKISDFAVAIGIHEIKIDGPQHGTWRKTGDGAIEYQKYLAENPGEEEVHARHILVASEEEAAAIIVELNGGADFAQLARERSTGPSGLSGGDLGVFTHSQMVPKFADAAFAMEVGAHSQVPVLSRFGWHIIKVEGKRKQTPPSFEKVEPRLRQQIELVLESQTRN